MFENTMSRKAFLAGGVGIAVMGATALSAFASEPGNGGGKAAEVDWAKETDVVVVGFGFAGLSAALDAAAQGADVIILEKAPEADAGGNSSACCGAWLWPDPEMLDQAAEYVRYQATENVSDEEIAALVEEFSCTNEWLDSLGVVEHFGFDINPGYNYACIPGAAAWKSCNQAQGLGFGLHTALKGAAEANDAIEIMYETPACKLVFDPATKEVFGVVVLDADGNASRIKARRGVVLACGGFENNQSMRSAYYPGRVPYAAAGSPYNTGDGIVMLGEVGAKMRGFDSIELLCHGCKAASDEIGAFVGFNFYDRAIWNGSIMVNDAGKRFVEESGRMHSGQTALRPVHQKCQLPELAFDMDTVRYPNLPMFLITDDARIQAGPLFNSAAEGARETYVCTHGWYTWSADNSAEVEKGWIVKADTLEELAGKLGIDPEGLVAQVEAWNADVEAGVDTAFNRDLGLVKLENPPFYGCELNLGIINTQGGAVRDEQHRVIDVLGNVIPRLYSAGELGSTFDFLYMGGGNVPEALAGRYAGRHAAQLEPWA